MYKQWNAILRQVSASTFEDLGFFLPDSQPSDCQLEARLQASVQVHFHGAFEGWLVVKLFGDLLEPLATNMLAAEEPPGDDLQWDALGELANVVCGNILPLFAGKEAVFALGSPTQSELASLPGEDPAAAVTLGLDEGRAEVCLFLGADASGLLTCEEPEDLFAAPAACPEEAA